MSSELKKLAPELLWKHFYELTQIPRPSKNEKKGAEYVINFAKSKGLEYKVDGFGNVVVLKPATAGKENCKTVVLQGHIDMVAEKNSDVDHDFDKDPIQTYIDGDWVKSKGTTLGADNGIGVAAALAVAEDENIKHGPLEILCTLDEETGMFGANAMEPGFLKGDIMLNLDSEEDGALYIGCSGGKNTIARFKYEREKVVEGNLALKVNVSGLKGGHSGLDIHQGRGNAIKILNRLLWGLSKEFGIRLADFVGGSKHNAIPRESVSIIVIDKEKITGVKEYIENYNNTVKAELATNEPNLMVAYSDAILPEYVVDIIVQMQLLNALYAVTNGVVTMSPDIEGLVETSTNLAVITTEATYFEVTTSQRSSVESEKDDVANQVASAFQLGGAVVKHSDSYPGWKPNVHSEILGIMKSVYEKRYNAEAEIKAIHAGLECGIIYEKFPNLDIISFGPTIMGAHSPDERVQISAVKKFYELLGAVLEEIPAK